jgi:hypothetical protein
VLSTRDTVSGPLLPVGDGDVQRLFIFVRAESREAGDGGWLGNGLELCDAAGRILSLFTGEHTESSDADGWLALSCRLPVGFYRLRWIDPSGARAIALHLFAGWDTQVFVPFDQRPRVEAASILLARSGQAFDPESSDAQTTDIGLLGLRQGRDLVPAAVRPELLSGKFHNPMLGLIGAHLLLMAPRPRADSIDTVLGRLRYDLLGDVADLRALEWPAWQRIGRERPPIEAFDQPPMLRAGTHAVIAADARVGGLIPADGSLSMVARYQRADSAWTVWSPRVQTRPRPQAEHTARPYLLPETGQVVYLDTSEDLDLQRESHADHQAEVGRTRSVEIAIDALRRGGQLGGGSRRPGRAPWGRPLDGLLRVGLKTGLDDILSKGLTRGPSPGAELDFGVLGPSLSVALPEPETAEAEADDDDWIDNLVSDALKTATRTGREVDIAALARAANLPRAVIEGRLRGRSEGVQAERG